MRFNSLELLLVKPNDLKLFTLTAVYCFLSGDEAFFCNFSISSST